MDHLRSRAIQMECGADMCDGAVETLVFTACKTEALMAPLLIPQLVYSIIILHYLFKPHHKWLI